MKTQTFARFHWTLTFCDPLAPFYTHQFDHLVLEDAGLLRRKCLTRYKELRFNGSQKDFENYSPPYDGEFTWIQGREEGLNVYGEKATGITPVYEYEVQYDEGPNDRKWMEQKDREYLTKLLSRRKLQDLEPAVWRLREIDEAQEIDIDEWWSLKQRLPNINDILDRSKWDYKQFSDRKAQEARKRAAAEKAKAKQDREERKTKAKAAKQDRAERKAKAKAAEQIENTKQQISVPTTLDQLSLDKPPVVKPLPKQPLIKPQTPPLESKATIVCQEIEATDEQKKLIIKAIKKKNIANLKRLLAEITSLNLNNFQIGDAGAKILTSALEDNHTITSLYLVNTKIGDAGTQVIAIVLANNNTLRTLDLSENKIGDAGGQVIAAALEYNRTLISLSLRANEIYFSARSIVIALDRRLTPFDLNWNPIHLRDPSLLIRMRFHTSHAVEKALDFARKQGNTDVIRLLETTYKEQNLKATSTSTTSNASENEIEADQNQLQFSRRLSFASLMNPYSTFYRPQIKQLPNLTQQMQPQSSRRLNFANLMNPYSFFGACNQETNTSTSAHSETLEDISLSATK